MRNLMDLSIQLIIFLQDNLSFLTPVMQFFTFLGNEEFYLGVMPILVWSFDHTLGLRVGVMLMLSGSVNSFFKFAFHQPRPYWVSRSVKLLTNPAEGFGLPSGHAQNAASTFGLLAAGIKQKWLKGVVIFTIFMIAFSRVFLGVHSIQDILLGLVVGSILLFAFFRIEKLLEEQITNLKPITRIALIFAISVTIALLGFLIINGQKNFQIPKDWVENALYAYPEESIDPFSADGILTTSGALFGLAAGGIWVQEKGGYAAKSGKLWQHLARNVLGIAGVLLLWLGLGEILPISDNLIGYVLRFFRYALVGVWVTGAAPLLFLRMKLAVEAE